MDDFPEFETYADVIDSYERDNMGYETLTDYIKGNNIKIKEIDISPLSDLKNMRDGGSVGIEVLFGPKVPAAPSQLVSESDILLGYRGDAAYRSGSEQATSIGQGNVGSKASFGGGKGAGEGASGAQVSRALEAQRLQNIANQNKKNSTIDTMKNVYGIVSPFINPASNLGKVKTIFDTYNLYKKGPFNEKDMTIGMTDQPLPSDNLLAFEPGSKKDKQLKSLFKEKGLTKDLGIPFAPKKEKKLQELMKEDQEQTDFPKTELLKAKDGGRVGLFMGGPALEGEALAIYNSMKAYGNEDQAIADKLQSLGMYTPGGTTPDAPTQPIGFQGGNDGQDMTFVDRQDYSFNKKNYAPGKQLEINPAAFGISFPDQPSGPKSEGIIGQLMDSFTSVPTRSLSSFASPTTGGNIVGPAEQGFMEQTLDIDPANRTREEIRSLYDSYNRFFGRNSNYADARVKGKAGQLFGNILGYAGRIPFLGKGIDKLSGIFGPRGDASDRSLYAVDNVGFGQGTGRDEFGVYTGGKTLLGDTTNYGQRMADRLGELEDFFGEKFDEKGFGTFDINNINPATLSKMKGINSFYAKQVQAYQQRLERDRINREQKEKERMAASAANRAEARNITNRLEKEFKESSGGGFAVSGPDTSANPTGASNRASQERGFALHGAKGGSVPTGLASMFIRRR